MSFRVLIFWLCVFVILIYLPGCGGGVGDGPRVRCASYPTATAGTNFLGPRLGKHGYWYSSTEKNGIAYTCAGGHIDISHLRKASDWTMYLAAKTRDKIKKGDSEFSFKLYEPSRYHVKLTYPEDWNDLSVETKEAVTHDISVRLGQYFAFTATTWHEILSWFGYKSTKFFPEHASAFSWEDSYSNLLGTYIAANVLYNINDFGVQDTNEYDMAMTVALDVEMEKLGIQPSSIARDAAASVRGKWFTGDLIFVDMKKRQFDIGANNGYVTPLNPAPGIGDCMGDELVPYPAPDLDFLAKYGFSVRFELEAREQVSKKILSVVYSDRENRKHKIILPDKHFARIMDYIERQAFEDKRNIPDEDMLRLAASGQMQQSMTGGTTWEADSGSFLDDDCPVNFRDIIVMTFRWLEGNPCLEQVW